MVDGSEIRMCDTPSLSMQNVVSISELLNTSEIDELNLTLRAGLCSGKACILQTLYLLDMAATSEERCQTICSVDDKCTSQTSMTG